jgi:hypothetical protein
MKRLLVVALLMVSTSAFASNSGAIDDDDGSIKWFDYWRVSVATNTEGVPQCMLASVDPNVGINFFFIVDANDRKAVGLYKSYWRFKKNFRTTFNFNFDGENKYLFNVNPSATDRKSIGFQVPKNQYDNLKDMIAHSNNMWITTAEGLSWRFRMMGSAAAVSEFDDCVNRLDY